MSSFTTEEIMNTLIEDMRMSRITKADSDCSLVKILKKQQELIEQNQKKIKEQRELIEHLWAWAEERDEAKYEGKTPSEADAEAYLNLMYPVEEEEKEEEKEDYWDWAGVAAALQDKYKTEWDDTTLKQCEGDTPKVKDDELAPVKYWGEQPLLDDSVLSSITDHEFDIDYRNFKLYDEYEGEKQGYTYLNDGPQGPGYYGLKLPLQWTPNIY